jgi:DNA replication and repair protein RecF
MKNLKCIFALRMYLQHLTLYNFKNYGEAEFNFESGANAFVGANGSGKTNILDSIYYYAFVKVFFIQLIV